MWRLSRLSLAAVLLFCIATAAVGQQVDDSSPRRTATVELIERCLPSVVALRTFRPHDQQGGFYVNIGSGSVVHESGYILTNDHVVSGAVRGEVSLPDGKTYPYRIVARLSTEDMALLKIDVDRPLKPLPLGRSDDLMLGEPALVIGNPGGLAHSVSTGIVSGVHRSTSTQGAFLPWTIQTSAAVSGGNSGGPLINALGEQIGIITSKQDNAENINFAIAVDRVREMFPRMLAAEQRYGFRLGVDVSMLGPVAKITAVADGSPAQQCGLCVGDEIQCIDDRPLAGGLDFHIALIDRKPGSQLALKIQRGDEQLSVTPVLAELPLSPPHRDEGMIQGLNFAAYQGHWQRLPDFAALKPVSTGTTDKPSVAVYESGGDFFGLRFEGFIKIPADGLYTFYTSSDDGSRLYIADQLVVDNDGLHATLAAAGKVRLKAGLHRIVATFFEAAGDQSLTVSWEGPDIAKQEIPATAYFVQDSKSAPQ